MPPAQQQQQGGDTSLGPFWVIIGFFALALAIWYFAHEQIALVVLKVRYAEAQLVSFFTDSIYKEMAIIRNTSPAAATFNKLASISTAVGNYMRYPIAALLGILAVIVYLSNPNLRYKKTYNMQQLAKDEKSNWPQITPVIELDLVNTDIDQGPWAMALTPMQFAKKNNLILIEKILPTEGLAAQSKLMATLKREDAYRVFALQLGRYWQGIDALNIHTKALFAVFAARADRDKEGAANMLLQIAASTKTGKLDFSGVEELLNKHRNNKAVIKVTENHGFILTVMASMILAARTDGVQAAADFLWLKPVDRSLWFMLDSVGRQTPFPEVSGPFAHWLAERKIGRKLNVPMLDEAVNALEEALKERVYAPDEGEIIRG